MIVVKSLFTESCGIQVVHGQLCNQWRLVLLPECIKDGNPVTGA
jgi:hypothetical protein